jgi:subtilase family serine protease
MKGHFTTLGIIKRIFIIATALSLVFIIGTATTGYHHVIKASGPGPDLIIKDITLSPENPAIGDSVTFTFTIRNQGTEESGVSRVAYYIDDNYIQSASIISLNAGVSVTKTLTWEAQGGSHVIKAIADSNDQVAESDETNNTKTFTFSPLAPDLVIQSISWSPETPSRGDSITFSVVIKNQGSSKAGFSRINFFIDGNSRGYQDIPLIDVGATITRTYSWTATVGQHDITAIADVDGSVTENNESNNKRTVTFSTLAPDLMVEDIVWSPESPSMQDTVSFNVTINNQGGGRADPCTVAFYINEYLIASDALSSMEAGDSVNMTFSHAAVTNPSSIKAVVDIYEHVTENDETNNEKTVIFSTALPDLVIRDVTWSPTDAAVGDNVTFTVTVENQGSGKAGESRIECHIGISYVEYLEVQEIAAGSQVTPSFVWAAQSNPDKVRVVADYDSKLAESNENNNTFTRDIAIAPPDLVVQEITWSPTDAIIGDTATFTAIIRNQGSGEAQDFYVACYIDDDLMTYAFINQIEPDATANATFTWLVQGSTHAVRAVADYNRKVIESDEDNNESTVTMVPAMPDLIIETITWSPADFPAGDKVDFNVIIKNQGSQKANTFRVTCFIDDSAAGYQDVASIDAGATVTYKFPWTALDGNHCIRITADANNQIDEIEENNNIRTLNIPAPDLIVQDINWSPADAAIGETVTFTVIIRNQGSGKADSSRVTCSVDGSIIGSDEAPAIEAGIGAATTFKWVAEAGANIIELFVDPDNQVTEVDETNNEKLIEFSTLTSDLVIKDAVWSMENPLISNDVEFVITVENQGSNTAGISMLTLYIDDSSAGNCELPQIPTGDTVTRTLTLSVRTGAHTARIVADSDGQVAEINEANNEKTLDFSTLYPDLVIRDITWTPTKAAVGQTVTFTINIRNGGKGEAINSSVALYINDSLVGSADLEEIDTGGIVTKAFDWIAEVSSFELRAVLDPGEAVVESNENNNMVYQTVSLQGEGGTADIAGTSIGTIKREVSFVGELWWLFVLVGILLGGFAFISAMKAFRSERK